MHARLFGHSLLLAHSGLQLGGELINPEIHAQEGDSLTTLHSELGPHGEGWQGFNFAGGVSAINSFYYNVQFITCY